jgi:hypothetical protein
MSSTSDPSAVRSIELNPMSTLAVVVGEVRADHTAHIHAASAASRHVVCYLLLFCCCCPQCLRFVTSSQTRRRQCRTSSISSRRRRRIKHSSSVTKSATLLSVSRIDSAHIFVNETNIRFRLAPISLEGLAAGGAALALIIIIVIAALVFFRR